MKKSLSFKKIFLTTLIGALIISACIGIYIVLFGTFGDIESRILATTLAIGGFSLTGLSCASLYEKKRLTEFALIGVTISIIAFIASTLMIWEIVNWDSEAYGKTLASLIILAFSWAHASLILMINPKESLVTGIQWSTVALIGIVAIMLIGVILFKELETEMYARLIGAIAILDVLGTLVTPISNKLYHSHN